MSDRDELAVWTVYKKPKDRPENFIARKFLTEAGRAVATSEVITADDLEVLQIQLERKGLTRLPRDWNDDPAIVEVWL